MSTLEELKSVATEVSNIWKMKLAELREFLDRTDEALYDVQLWSTGDDQRHIEGTLRMM